MSSVARADDPSAAIPKCWSADQPGQEIQEGTFRVLVQTEDLSARDLARVLFLLQGAMATETAVAANGRLDTVEIDLRASVAEWRPSAAFPTQESLKSYILSTLAPVAQLPGVSIQCYQEPHRHPLRVSGG